MNIYRLIYLTPMPTATRLWLRRYFLDRETDREFLDFEYDFLEDDEASFHSKQLLTRARKLRIPRPPLNSGAELGPDYVRSGVDGRRFFLSLAGEQKVRAAIREEEKYRSERWTRRIPYITALTGLIGAVTGLVALLSKWGS